MIPVWLLKKKREALICREWTQSIRSFCQLWRKKITLEFGKSCLVIPRNLINSAEIMVQAYEVHD